MTLEKLEKEIESRYPRRNAEEWDNVGLIIGDKNQEITGIVLTVDVDMQSIEIAIREGANLIISHHPMIFTGIKKIDYSSTYGRKIKKIIQNNINVYSLHTNIDSTIGGLNDYILSEIGVSNSKILCKGKNEDFGIGRYYKLEESVTIEEYVEKIKNLLKLEEVKLYLGNDGLKKCHKVALINGSGAEMWKSAKFYGCNLLITSDVKYHVAFDAVEEGLSILDIGHYESEKLFIKLLEKKLKEIDEKIKLFLNENREIARKI